MVVLQADAPNASFFDIPVRDLVEAVMTTTTGSNVTARDSRAVLRVDTGFYVATT